MTKKNLKTIKALISQMSWTDNVRKIQEEAMELSLELHQYLCPTKKEAKRLEKVYEEFADLKIQMRKAEMMFNRKKINKLVNKKLEKERVRYGIK